MRAFIIISVPTVIFLFASASGVELPSIKKETEYCCAIQVLRKKSLGIQVELNSVVENASIR